MAGRRTGKPGWFWGPLDVKVQRRAALICALVALCAWFLARVTLQLPPAWVAALAPTAWLVPFWAGGLCIMFIATTLTLERPQHARWHQAVAALIVSVGACAVYLPGDGLNLGSWPDLFLADQRLRLFAVSAFVLSMVGGLGLRPLFAARALIMTALLVFTVIWFDTGAVWFIAGGSEMPTQPFLFMAYGLLATWAPLLAWTSIKTRRDS